MSGKPHADKGQRDKETKGQRDAAGHSIPRPLGPSPFSALFRISQLFNSILDPDELYGRVMDEAVAALNAERGLLMLAEPDAEHLAVRAARHIDGRQELSIASQTVLKDVIESREPRVYLDAPGSFPASQSIIVAQVRSVACAPLVCKGRVVGAVYLDSRTSHAVFADDALGFLSAFAGIAALAIENARLHTQLVNETQELRDAVHEWNQFPEIVGRSAPMQEVFKLMNRVIPTDAAVLIMGETGTGKELVARAIHYNGPRQRQPFVCVNCGAIPEGLLESELFGAVRGAYTGAVSDRKGLFETANGGTVFLDEIADMPLALQPKLLRVLQSGELRPVGDTRPTRVDVRVISATNRDLNAMVAEARFREDLFYRLNVFPFELPPLRLRPDDVPLLANHFLAAAAERLKKPVRGIEPEALARLTSFPWPGNVRQLENVIERAVVLAGCERLAAADIVLPASSNQGTLDASSPMAAIEKQVVLERLRRFAGNRSRTAASLGISRRTLLNKLAEWKENGEQE